MTNAFSLLSPQIFAMTKRPLWSIDGCGGSSTTLMTDGRMLELIKFSSLISDRLYTKRVLENRRQKQMQTHIDHNTTGNVLVTKEMVNTKEMMQ